MLQSSDMYGANLEALLNEFDANCGKATYPMSPISRESGWIGALLNIGRDSIESPSTKRQRLEEHNDTQDDRALTTINP